MKKLCLLLCFMSINLWGQHAYAVTCTVGIVPQFHHDKLFKIWRPILKSLEEKTECEFIWKRNKDIPDFEKNLFDGEYDIAYASPMHVLIVYDSLGYTPIVSSSTKRLEGVLVVPKDSDYDDVSDLEGKQIAFPAPNAVVGSLVLRAELDRHFGINIEPRYVGSHSRVYAAVAKKEVVAGGGVMGTLESQSSDMRGKLKIIYKTKSYMPHAVIVHPRVGEEIKESIREAFLKLSVEKPELFGSIPMPDPNSVTIKSYNDIEALNLEDYWVPVGEKN